MENLNKKSKINKNHLILIGAMVILAILCLIAFIVNRVNSAKNPPNSITISDTQAELMVNDTFTLTATLNPEDSDGSISWRTDNGKVVTVENGVLTAKAIGSATVTAYSDNVSATCTVTVINALEDFNFELITNENAYSLTKYVGTENTIIVPSSYKGLPVIRVDSYAFSDNNTLTSITLAPNFKELADNAFNDLPHLQTLNLPDGLVSVESNAITNCPNLKYNKEEKGNLEYLGNEENPYLLLVKPTSKTITECTVNEKTKVIYSGAFSGCAKLTTLNLSESIEYIGANSFADCDRLNFTEYENATYVGTKDNKYFALVGVKEGSTYLYINNATKIIAQDTLSRSPELKTLSIGDGITKIAKYEFTDRENSNFSTTNLETIIIGNGVKSIGNFAFEGQKNLKLLSLGNGLTSIGIGAFYECLGLESVVIPSSVKTLGTGAFYKCAHLSDVYFNSGITTIGQQAFYECTQLKRVYLPDTIKTIGQAAFGNCYGLETLIVAGNNSFNIEKLAFENAFNLTYADLGGVNSVGAFAFNNAFKLNHLELGENVTSITDSAFYNCYSLTEINLPDTIKTIGTSAFENCYGLLKIRLGKDLTSIGNDAFKGDNKIISVSNYSSFEVVDVKPTTPTEQKVAVIPAQKVFNEKHINVLQTAGDYIFYIDDKEDLDNSNDEYFLVGYTGTEDKITLPETFNGKNYTVYKYALYNDIDLNEITIPSTVLGVQEYAFGNCFNLYKKEVNGVTTDAKAFDNSNKLTTLTPVNTDYYFANVSGKYVLTAYAGSDSVLTLPEPSEISSGVTEYSIADYAFYNNANLTSVTLPEGVTKIGNYAFGLCQNLTAINLPQTLTGLGKGAFWYCVNLKAIDLPSSVTVIGDDTFMGCYHLSDVDMKNTVTKIGNNAFRFCFGIKQITLSTGLTTLGVNAFYNCMYLTSITIPENVKTISASAFAYCYRINSISLPEGLLTISANAFKECDRLVRVDIPASVTKIENYAFSQCEGLTEYNVASGNAKYASQNGVLFDKDMTQLISYPTSKTDRKYTVPHTVTQIGKSAFAYSTNLKEVVLPEGLTKIDDAAFYSCKFLQKINLPSTVTKISANAFGSCGSLIFNEYENAKYLGNDQNPHFILFQVIDKKVESFEMHQDTAIIFDYAFSGCSKLESITITANVTQINPHAFSSCLALKGIIFTEKSGWSAQKQDNDNTTVDIDEQKLATENSALNTARIYLDYKLTRTA